MGTNRRLSRFVVVALLVLSLPLLAPAAGARAPSTTQRGLTAEGVLLWNFEGLLRKHVRNPEDVWRTGDPSSPYYNFSCCGSRGTHATYRYVFRPPGGTSFHLSTTKFPPGVWGVNPAQVLIRGRSVACDARETRFLITYRGTASLTLNCTRRPY